MQLIDIKTKENSKKYKFGISVKDDFLNYAISIEVDADKIIQRIECNSHVYGIASWGLSGKLFDCTSWESEAELNDMNSIAKNYQLALEGDSQDNEFAFKILEDCLAAAVVDSYLYSTTKNFCSINANKIYFDLSKFNPQ